jgi:hypothetical protein
MYHFRLASQTLSNIYIHHICNSITCHDITASLFVEAGYDSLPQLPLSHGQSKDSLLVPGLVTAIPQVEETGFPLAESDSLYKSEYQSTNNQANITIFYGARLETISREIGSGKGRFQIQDSIF